MDLNLTLDEQKRSEHEIRLCLKSVTLRFLAFPPASEKDNPPWQYPGRSSESVLFMRCGFL